VTVDDLTQCFEDQRGRLKALAYRVLGSRAAADDAVQEAWLRLNRMDASGIDNLGGWLTTVVSRVCLDELRSRKFIGEAPDETREAALEEADTTLNPGPEQEAELADNIGVALMVVLERLPPPERVAFVLHDSFDLSFDEIAPILNRTSTAARQLASRARRKVQGAAPAESEERSRHREVAAAFLAAARSGDLAGLLAVLAPDVVLHADAASVKAASANPQAPQFAPRIEGAPAVAEVFKGKAQAARLARVNDLFGAVFTPGGTVRAAFEFVIEGGLIVEIGLIGEPEQLGKLEVQICE
jgi:RNA polymerase sigma-70 factor (ECF subfamily)